MNRKPGSSNGDNRLGHSSALPTQTAKTGAVPFPSPLVDNEESQKPPQRLRLRVGLEIPPLPNRPNKADEEPRIFGPSDRPVKGKTGPFLRWAEMRPLS